MAGLHLVTGYKGAAHVTSADQGVLNAMTVGVNDYVFTKGRRFEAQIISNNAVRIYDGSLMMNGRQVNLDAGSYLDAVIANGTQGMNRHDIIAIRYILNRTTGVETAHLGVHQGTPAAGTPTDPENQYSDSILNGVTTHDMNLYRVVLEGLTITRVEPLFQLLAPMADIQHGFYKQNMLINGDFQCNQRGEKTYDATDSVKYTVDMWRAHQVKVKVLNEGVEITGSSAITQGFFTQFIQIGKLKTTTYTISAMADDKICTFTVTPGGSAKSMDFGKFMISALTTSTWDDDLGDYNNKLKINICPVGTNTITFKYIDVFEGIVAYPHVKEDYATALMRCALYIQSGTSVCPTWGAVDEVEAMDGSNYKYRFGISFQKMLSTSNNPITLDQDYGHWDYHDPARGTIRSNDMTDLEILNTTKDLIEVKTTLLPFDQVFYHGFRVAYLVSCEPNPNGD